MYYGIQPPQPQGFTLPQGFLVWFACVEGVNRIVLKLINCTSSFGIFLQYWGFWFYLDSPHCYWSACLLHSAFKTLTVRIGLICTFVSTSVKGFGWRKCWGSILEKKTLIWYSERNILRFHSTSTFNTTFETSLEGYQKSKKNYEPKRIPLDNTEMSLQVQSTYST